MAFVNNTKLLEIRNAARNGNEKAAMVLQALRKGANQDDLDRLVGSYYEVDIPQHEPINAEPEQAPSVDVQEQIEPETELQPEEPEIAPTEQEQVEPELQPEHIENTNEVVENSVVDLTDLLDKDMDGLISQTEIKDLTFNDFLKNKSSDINKMKKNADYFKAYNAEGRQNYMNNKINEYNGSFDGRRKDIDRRYNDIAKALGIYNQNVNDMLDDDFEFDTDQSSKAYNDFVNDKNIMSSFGRHWDDGDNNVIIQALSDLSQKYGKKNVSAMISTLGADNNGYKDFLNNQIDSEVSRYTKDIEKLLK